MLTVTLAAPGGIPVGGGQWGDVESNIECTPVCRSLKGNVGELSEETRSTFQNGAKMGYYGKEQVSKASEGRGMPACVVLDQGLSAFHLMVTGAHLSWAQVVVDWVYLVFSFSDSVAPFASESFPVRSAHCHHFSVLTALMLRQRFSRSEASHVLQTECHSSVWKFRNTTIPIPIVNNCIFLFHVHLFIV